jgi:Mur ligase middle domain
MASFTPGSHGFGLKTSLSLGQVPNDEHSQETEKTPVAACEPEVSDGLAGEPARAMLPHVTYVGVTGSCAKTTTTRLIGTVLEQAGRCRTADANGIPPLSRNLLSVGFLTRFCVQEISGDHPGKIRLQTKILRPQIGVVTTIGSDHYAKFRSLEATAREKRRLVKDLPGRGIAILNADDPNVWRMRKHTRARGVIRPVAECRGQGNRHIEQLAKPSFFDRHPPKQESEDPNQTRRRVLGDFGFGRRHLRHCLWTRLADLRQSDRDSRAQPCAVFGAPCSGRPYFRFGS